MIRLSASMTIIMVFLATAAPAWGHAGHGARIVSYDPGTTPHLDFDSGLPLDIATAALGEPERSTGDGLFPSVVSPFSPPFLRTELVSIGEGGQLTLQLSHFAISQADQPEIGVFTNAGLADADGDFNNPNARASGIPVSRFGVDPAVVEVSADGLAWFSLGEIDFGIPSNGFADQVNPFAAAPGDVPADFHEPFVHSPSDFAELPHFDAEHPDILGLFAGSGGGTWLDLSPAQLDRVGFLRFSVPDDGDGSTAHNFELDAVTVATRALGQRVPEPGAWILLLLAAGGAGSGAARR